MTSLTNGEANGEILKTDTRGRVRVSVERREALLEEFERSGLSGAAFVKVVGMNYGTFASWIQKRRKARSLSAGGNGKGPGAGQVRLIEATMEPMGNGRCGGQPSSGGALIVELPGGGRARIEGAAQTRLMAELLVAISRMGVAC